MRFNNSSNRDSSDLRLAIKIRLRVSQFVTAILCAFACALVTPAVAVTLHLLPVGDPGNAVDPRPGANLGAVSYTYYLDKYDVTNAQYAEFLNAKASEADPYALYHTFMGGSANGGIVRSASTPFSYSLKAGMANKPVVFVSWYDALRFTNWLTNGQRGGDTENGSYLIANGGPDGGAITVPTAAQRAAWSSQSAHYLLPSADEWYKAAYYKGGGTNAGYWKYPLSSNTPPQSGPPCCTANGANIVANGIFAVPGPVHLTDVGAYGTQSPYGMFDMAGNVFQYSDTFGRITPNLAEEWGGSWITGADATDYIGSGGSTPANGYDDIGFRIAMVPEPGSLTLAALAALGLFAWRCGSRTRKSR